MINLKPILSLCEVELFLETYFDSKVEQLEMVKEGHLKQVYFFEYLGNQYVIRFSYDKDEYTKELYLYKMYAKDGLIIPKVVELGIYKDIFFSISHKAIGKALNTLKNDEMQKVMPSFIEAIAKLHSVDVGTSKGYGWLNACGDGIYKDFNEYIESVFSKEQDGFWKNWYDLFKNSMLEENLFWEIYKKMITLCKYSEPHRYLVHGDCHFGNIISNAENITGIIDWGNVMYGDFVYDIAFIHMQYPKVNFPKLFEEYYNSKGIDIPNYKERLIYASYCKGLDSLRFFAKIGRKESYESVKKYLLSLSN